MHIDLEAISGIAGSISIASWVVVFSPQIIENFRRSSAEGLSVVFVFVWLIGDVFNILGAVLQGVLPTMIILAVYYTLADIVLLAQCFYYRGFTLSDKITPKPSGPDADAAPTEHSALLSNGSSRAESPDVQQAFPIPNGERRRSSFRDQLTQSGTQLSPAVPMHQPRRDEAAAVGQSPDVQKKPRSLVKAFFFNATAVLVVCAAGVLGWWLSTAHGSPHRHHHHHHHDSKKKLPHERHEDSALHFNVLGQVFGYVCAVLYLGSRVPQLLLNYRRKSTEGISMLFFIFACIGNATYVASILVYEPVCYRPNHCRSGEATNIYWRYFLVNLSWLVGSFGTLLLDAAVFVQYFRYRGQQGPDVVIA